MKTFGVLLIFTGLFFLPGCKSTSTEILLHSYPGTGEAMPAKYSDLPDFSYAGYEYGERKLPSVAIVLKLQPSGGDDWLNIQQSVQNLEKAPLGKNGYRGTILLSPGTYNISRTVQISKSGVVLQGSGERGHTLIKKTGKNGDCAILVAPGLDVSPTEFRRSYVTDKLVRNGSRSLNIESADRFPVGSKIYVVSPSTWFWVDKLNQAEQSGDPWTPGRVDRRYYRTIIAKEGTNITLDAPIFDILDGSDGAAYVMLDSNSYISNIGIENLTIITADSPENGKKSRVGIRLSSVINSWIKVTSVKQWSLSGIEITKHSRNITIEDCTVDDAQQDQGFERGFAFRTKHAQLILFKNCAAAGARYSFASSGGSFDSCIVFLKCYSRDARIEDFTSTGHWAQALLFDNVEARSGKNVCGVALYNRKDKKDGEMGYNATNSVVWNCNISESLRVDRPPFGQNYVIGGTFLGNTAKDPGFESKGPQSYLSLYEKQKIDRLR